MEFNFPCDLEPCCVVAQSGKSRSVKKILVNVKFEGSEVSEFMLIYHSFMLSGNSFLWYNAMYLLSVCADNVK